jgi:hypothetical protein
VKRRTFVKLILHSEKTASALNKIPGPSSRVKTILVCNNSSKCKNEEDNLKEGQKIQPLRNNFNLFPLSLPRSKMCYISLAETSQCHGHTCKASTTFHKDVVETQSGNMKVPKVISIIILLHSPHLKNKLP